MKNVFLPAILLIYMLFSAPVAQAQQKSDNQSLDQIVALVNDHIILKSEVNQRAVQYVSRIQQSQQRNVEFSKKIWYTVLQNMVDNFVLLDQAKVDSVTVTESRVDQQIDRRIDQAVQRLGSKSALEDQFGKSIIQIRADLRDQYRQQITIQQYRAQKRDEIEITRPEVEDYFNRIPTDSLPTIPEKVGLSQIAIVPPPKNEAGKKAKQFAQQLRDSVINHGKSIENLARKYSDGPSASKGGHIPMISLDQLVPEYSAAAAALEPGEISKVVKTSFGYHVIRLNKRRGDKIDTNHILIAVDKDSYNKEAAIKELKQIKDSLKNHEDVTFADIARKESEDPNTAPQGGRILNPDSGAPLITVRKLDPALGRIVLLLDKEGDISEPKPFTIGNGDDRQDNKRAYRIVRLDKHVNEHVANLKDDYDAIKQTALRDKQYRLMQKWVSNLKKNVYIEYKIPVPKGYANLEN